MLVLGISQAYGLTDFAGLWTLRAYGLQGL